MGTGEIVVDLIALDLHANGDRQHPLPGRGVAVEVVDRLPYPVRQLGDPLPGDALDVVLHFLEGRHHGVLPVLVDQAQDLPLGDRRRRRLGVHVAYDGGRVPRVRSDQPPHVRSIAVAVPEPHRRNPDRLAEHVLGADIEGSGHTSTEVGPVPVGLTVGNQVVADEDGAHDAHVAEMGAPGIRVVDHEHVAGVDVALECFDDRLGREMEGPHVRCDVLSALGDGVSVDVAQRRGEIPVEDHEGMTRP